MIYLAGAFGLFLLITGSIPVGRFPFFFRSSVSLSSILLRVSGAMIIAGLFLPDQLLENWYGTIILLAGALLLIFVSLIASLTGRAP